VLTQCRIFRLGKPALSGLIPANKPQRNISHKKAQNAQKAKGIKGLFSALSVLILACKTTNEKLATKRTKA